MFLVRWTTILDGGVAGAGHISITRTWRCRCFIVCHCGGRRSMLNKDCVVTVTEPIPGTVKLSERPNIWEIFIQAYEVTRVVTLCFHPHRMVHEQYVAFGPE